jgi:hypothetical protein
MVQPVPGAVRTQQQPARGGALTPAQPAMPAASALATTVTPSAAPAPPGYSFGDGQYVVGADVPAGTYRTRAASQGCYWARLRGFSGELSDLIANENTDAPEVVTIAPTDVGFNSARCGLWTNDLSAITSSPTDPVRDGTYIVGVDIAPGTWRAGGSSGCYWARLSGFGGTLDDIIANSFTTSASVVTISPTDQGFRSEGCGTWTQVQ